MVEFVLSPNLASFKGAKCTLGIDEAGRGPVLGPMVYAIAVCRTDQLSALQTLEVADSKEINEERRESIFAKMNADENIVGNFGYAIRVLSPQYISTCMLRRVKYNLNELSHETAMKLIQVCVENGIEIDAVYVDTVGPPESYQAKLKGRFPSLNITVSKKADSLFPIVSAASICAKVTRDNAVKDWPFPEIGDGTMNGSDVGVGSGYPGDPATKEFLRKHIDPVFGFPSIVRFSWSTAEEMISKQCVKVRWEDDNVKAAAIGTKSILNYFHKINKQETNAAKGTIPPAVSVDGATTAALLDQFNLQVVNHL